MNNNHNGNCDHLIGSIIDHRWKITRRLGSGAFGSVYKAHNIYDRGQAVAVKMERIGQISTLRNELAFYQLLGRGVPGFPSLHGYARTPDHSHRALIISLLGESLSTLERTTNMMLCHRNIFNIAVQVLKLLRTLHATGYVHSDIKPANIVIGRRDRNVIHLVDFGMAARYKCIARHRHITEDLFHTEPPRLRVTSEYASINSHYGRRLTRRDDLESLAYTLIYLARGSLPWYGMPSEYEILRSKERSSPLEVCGGLPTPFRILLMAALELGFDEKPDYRGLCEMFQSAIERRGGSLTDEFRFM